MASPRPHAHLQREQVVAARVAWRHRMRSFGAQLRRVRELVGLSQEAVVRAAGVSQAAMSRLERGQGVSIPLVAVLKTRLVLERALPANGGEPSEGLQRALDREHWLSALVDGVEVESSLPAPDTELEEIVRLFRGLPLTGRTLVARVVRAMAADPPSRRGRRRTP